MIRVIEQQVSGSARRHGYGPESSPVPTVPKLSPSRVAGLAKTMSVPEFCTINSVVRMAKAFPCGVLPSITPMYTLAGWRQLRMMSSFLSRSASLG